MPDVRVTVEKAKFGARLVATGPFVAPLQLFSHGFIRNVFRQIRTGDARFDDQFYVLGDEALALVTLTAAARSKLRALAKKGSITLDKGELVLIVEGMFDVVAMGAFSRDLRSVGNELVAKPEMKKRLAQLAKEKPALAGRIAKISLPALGTGIVASTDELRHTAIFDGNDGRRLLAVERLIERLPAPKAVLVLSEVLAARLDVEKEDDLLVTALLRACEATGKWPRQPGVRKALELLVEKTSGDARMATVQLLAKVGAASSLKPLVEAGTGLFRSAALKRACADAVRAIEARLGERGTLSVAEPDAGALSEEEP